MAREGQGYPCYQRDMMMMMMMNCRTRGCLNRHGNQVTANNSFNYNAVFFFVSDLKIEYYNNY